MKGLTVYATFTLVAILVLCSSIIHGGCPSRMIGVGHLCYKWYTSTLSLTGAIRACRKEGGDLAGNENQNFLEIIQENLVLEEYLPKENCYWANLPSASLRLSRTWWLKPIVPDFFMEAMVIYFNYISHPKICYQKTKWEVEIVNIKRRVNFVCEYEVTTFEEDRRRRDVREVKFVRMERDSDFIADQPLFEEGAPVLTMCSRLCQGFTGCSMFNYNKLTKQCRGFGEMEEMHIHYHQDWEVWVFK